MFRLLMRDLQPGRGRTRQRVGVLVGLVMICAGESWAECLYLPSIGSVRALDEATKTTRSWDDERTLRNFALYAYRDVANDLIERRGPYLDTLAAQFQAACSDPVEVATWLRALLTSTASATDFSRRLAVAHSAATTSTGSPVYHRSDR